MSEVVRGLVPLPPPEGLTTDQAAIWNIMEQIKLSVLRKNTDYGSSVFDAPVAAQHISVPDAILIRVSDKIKRINQLRSNRAFVEDEKVFDTAMDASAYFALLCIALQRESLTTPVPAPDIKAVTRGGKTFQLEDWVQAKEMCWNGTKKLITGKILAFYDRGDTVQVSKYFIPVTELNPYSPGMNGMVNTEIPDGICKD